VAFFVLTLSLYLGRIYERKHATAAASNALPTISVPATPAPAAAPVAAPSAVPAATPTPEKPKTP